MYEYVHIRVQMIKQNSAYEEYSNIYNYVLFNANIGFFYITKIAY